MRSKIDRRPGGCKCPLLFFHFLSTILCNSYQSRSKSQVRDNFHELNGSVASLGRKVAAVTFYVCESLSFDVSIYYIYICVCLTTMHIV